MVTGVGRAIHRHSDRDQTARAPALSSWSRETARTRAFAISFDPVVILLDWSVRTCRSHAAQVAIHVKAERRQTVIWPPRSSMTFGSAASGVEFFAAKFVECRNLGLSIHDLIPPCCYLERGDPQTSGLPQTPDMATAYALFSSRPITEVVKTNDNAGVRPPRRLFIAANVACQEDQPDQDPSREFHRRVFSL